MPFTNTNTSTHHRNGLTRIKTTVELSGLPKVVKAKNIYNWLQFLEHERTILSVINEAANGRI